MNFLTKKTSVNSKVIVLLWLGFLTLTNSCKPLIALHDPESYRTALDLKVEFKYLVESSSDSYLTKSNDVLEFQKAIEKALLYERGRYRNELTVAQYDIMKGILNRFVDTWKQNDTISDFTRKEFLEESQAAFDEIIKLEKNKRSEGIKLNIDEIDIESPQTN